MGSERIKFAHVVVDSRSDPRKRRLPRTSIGKLADMTDHPEIIAENGESCDICRVKVAVKPGCNQGAIRLPQGCSERQNGRSAPRIVKQLPLKHPLSQQRSWLSTVTAAYCRPSRYTRGTLCRDSCDSYRALVSDPSLVNTTFTFTPRYFHGGNTGSNPVGDANKI
jgi:hypothetical protein